MFRLSVARDFTHLAGQPISFLRPFSGTTTDYCCILLLSDLVLLMLLLFLTVLVFSVVVHSC